MLCEKKDLKVCKILYIIVRMKIYERNEFKYGEGHSCFIR